MPEMDFGVIMFCLFSAMAFCVEAVWLVEKKGIASRLDASAFTVDFMVGSVVFSSVYVLNRLVYPGSPKAAAACNILFLSGIYFYSALKKKLRRLRRRIPKAHKNLAKSPLQIEAAALEHMLELDPLNAFCFEKLSEIYEKMGKRAKALEAAREAVKLDPTIINQWRVEELKKRSRGKERA